MAKSARASTKKRNNANLRSKVFGPAHDARTERLSAKLQELANTPKPEQEGKKDMDVDSAQTDEGKVTDVSADIQGTSQLSSPFELLLTLCRRSNAMDWPRV